MQEGGYDPPELLQSAQNKKAPGTRRGLDKGNCSGRTLYAPSPRYPSKSITIPAVFGGYYQSRRWT